MTGSSLAAREAEILRLLGVLHRRGGGFTLIGGYAVDAYSALPRYSVDCDIVASTEASERVSSLLNEEGYEKGEMHRNESEGIESRKFVKRVGEDQVSVDLMVGGVRCRQTEAVWKEDEVRSTSKELRVVGVSGSVLSRVASKELLLALKLHSGRDPDLRDVVMLAAGADWNTVGELSSRGSKARVILQLEADVRILGDDEFEGRLKAYFGLRKGARQAHRRNAESGQEDSGEGPAGRILCLVNPPAPEGCGLPAQPP